MRVPPGFTLLHKHFVCKVPHAFPPKTWPRPGPGARDPGGGVGWVGGVQGTELGGGLRWQLHSRCNPEAVGTGEILHSHLAN